MPKFVIDEDMARSTGMMLKEHGYGVVAQGIRFKDFHSCLEGFCILRAAQLSLKFFSPKSLKYGKDK